jgi:hypothetical protein
MSDISDKAQEIDIKIKKIWSLGTKEAAEKLGMDENITAETIMKDMGKYFDISLDKQIEYNLVGLKGYDGMNVPRITINESIWDIQRTLLNMDTVDWKISPMMSSFYEKEIARLERAVRLQR